MTKYVKFRDRLLSQGFPLRKYIVNILMLKWFFHGKTLEPFEGEFLADAAKVGIDPLVLIRSREYLLNPQHYERSI